MNATISRHRRCEGRVVLVIYSRFKVVHQHIPLLLDACTLTCVYRSAFNGNHYICDTSLRVTAYGIDLFSPKLLWTVSDKQL